MNTLDGGGLMEDFRTATATEGIHPYGKPIKTSGRDTLYSPQYSDIPPPLPQPHIAPSLSNPLLLPLSPSSPLFSIQEPLNLLGKDRGYSSVGELYEFCSQKEKIEKQRTSTANDLERLNIALTGDPEARLVNHHLALKSFQRSDASKQFKPEETRPLVICRKAVHMILTYFVDADIIRKPYLYRRENDESYSYLDIYNFLRDRLRAIWQDLTVQHGGKHRASIETLEISCRFLILGEGLLCDRPREEFDPIQNSSLMTTCLDKLMSGYEDVRHFLQRPDVSQMREKDPNLFDLLVYQSPYEAEFLAYRILLNATSENSSGFLDTVANIPFDLRLNEHVLLAIDAHKAFHSINILRYFKLLKKATYLEGILLHKYSNFMRVRYIPVLVASFPKHSNAMKMKAALFRKQYGCEEEDDFVWHSLVEYFGIRMISREVLDFREVDVQSFANICTFKQVKIPPFRSKVLDEKWERLGITRQLLLDPGYPQSLHERKPFLQAIQSGYKSTVTSTDTIKDIFAFGGESPTARPPFPIFPPKPLDAFVPLDAFAAPSVPLPSSGPASDTLPFHLLSKNTGTGCSFTSTADVLPADTFTPTAISESPSDNLSSLFQPQTHRGEPIKSDITAMKPLPYPLSSDAAIAGSSTVYDLTIPHSNGLKRRFDVDIPIHMKQNDAYAAIDEVVTPFGVPQMPKKVPTNALKATVEAVPPDVAAAVTMSLHAPSDKSEGAAMDSQIQQIDLEKPAPKEARPSPTPKSRAKRKEATAAAQETPVAKYVKSDDMATKGIKGPSTVQAKEAMPLLEQSVCSLTAEQKPTIDPLFSQPPLVIEAPIESCKVDLLFHMKRMLRHLSQNCNTMPTLPVDQAKSFDSNSSLIDGFNLFWKILLLNGATSTLSVSTGALSPDYYSVVQQIYECILYCFLGLHGRQYIDSTGSAVTVEAYDTLITSTFSKGKPSFTNQPSRVYIWPSTTAILHNPNTKKGKEHLSMNKAFLRLPLHCCIHALGVKPPMWGFATPTSKNSSITVKDEPLTLTEGEAYEGAKMLIWVIPFVVGASNNGFLGTNLPANNGLKGENYVDINSEASTQVWTNHVSLLLQALSNVQGAEDSSAASKTTINRVVLVYTVAISAHLEMLIAHATQVDLLDFEMEEETYELINHLYIYTEWMNDRVKQKLLDAAQRLNVSHEQQLQLEALMPQCVTFYAASHASVEANPWTMKKNEWLISYPKGISEIFKNFKISKSTPFSKLQPLEKPMKVESLSTVLPCIWKASIERMHSTQFPLFHQFMGQLLESVDLLLWNINHSDPSVWVLPPAEWRICPNQCTVESRNNLTSQRSVYNTDFSLCRRDIVIKIVENLKHHLSLLPIPTPPESLNLATNPYAAFDIINEAFHKWISGFCWSATTAELLDALWLPYSLWAHTNLNTLQPWGGMNYPPQILVNNWKVPKIAEKKSYSTIFLRAKRRKYPFMGNRSEVLTHTSISPAVSPQLDISAHRRRKTLKATKGKQNRCVELNEQQEDVPTFAYKHKRNTAKDRNFAANNFFSVSSAEREEHNKVTNVSLDATSTLQFSDIFAISDESVKTIYSNSAMHTLQFKERMIRISENLANYKLKSDEENSTFKSLMNKLTFHSKAPQ